MAHVDQNLILNDGRVAEILKYFEQDGAMEKNKEAVVTLKKDKASENIVIAGFFLVISVLATVYGIADVFGGARLPMGILFLIAGPIGVSFLSVIVAKGIRRVASAAEYSYAGSIEALCKEFYFSAFFKAITDTELRDDYFADTAHLIPAPVWKDYTIFSGLIRLEGKAAAPTGEAKPVECVECHKKHAHSDRINIPLPISDRDENAAHKKQTTYLLCLHCGHKICYKCMVKSEPKELRYLCQACGKATNGMEGLSERWDSCRREFIHADEDFGISEISVSQGDRINEKAVKIVVSLTGKPYGSMEFKNVAIHIGESWFLATPEPLIKK